MAATPAAWIPMNVPVSMNVFTLASAAEISGLATDQPQRHPVMLYVFESEWNSIATSRAPSISKMLGGTYPSNASSEYALSYTSRMSSSRQRFTTRWRYSTGAIAAVGLFG